MGATSIIMATFKYNIISLFRYTTWKILITLLKLFVMNKIKTFINAIVSMPNYVYNNIQFKLFNVNILNCRICGRIFLKNKGVIKIDENFKANSGINCNPIGGDTILRLITTKNGSIEIGKNVGISNTTIFCTNKITIEDNVLIGGGCKIWDTNFHSLDYYLKP